MVGVNIMENVSNIDRVRGLGKRGISWMNRGSENVRDAFFIDYSLTREFTGIRKTKLHRAGILISDTDDATKKVK